MPAKTILLSKHLWISRKDLEKRGVYDYLLWIDTKIFIDPKLLDASKIPEFKESRKKILAYFKALLKIINVSDRSEQLKDKAISLLATWEPIWLSIWYWNKTDSWTTMKVSVAKDIIRSSIEMLHVWIDEPELIEVMALFIKWFWADSLSDLTSHILYKELCEYTQRVSRELWVSTSTFLYDWISYELPRHPFKDNQVILLPIEIVRELPIASSWKDIDYVIKFNQQLRDDWNGLMKKIIISKTVEIKSENIDLGKARIHMKDLLNIYKKIIPNHYDIDTDTKWCYHLPEYIEKLSTFFEENSENPVEDTDDIITRVRKFLSKFQRAIESNGGNKLLYHREWNGWPVASRPHHESVSQLLFYIMADQYCSQYGIMLSWESDAWNWPVDFTLGTWYDEKVVVEIKKSTNRHIVSWFESQVEVYKDSENAVHGFYLIIELWDEYAERSKPVEKLVTSYPSGVSLDGTSEIYLVNWRLQSPGSTRKV